MTKTLLKAMVDGTPIAEFQPQNNTQAYLAYLNGLDIELPEPRNNEEALLYKLCVDGIGVAPMSGVVLDFSNCSLSSEVAVGVFKSLRDVTAEGGKNIILTGNPCITGVGVFKSGRKTVKNHDEVCAIFNDIPLDTEISAKVDNEGMVWYASIEIALDQLQYAQYPMEISWEDVTYYVKKLTDEDMAIATNKGWKLVLD